MQHSNDPKLSPRSTLYAWFCSNNENIETLVVNQLQAENKKDEQYCIDELDIEPNTDVYEKINQTYDLDTILPAELVYDEDSSVFEAIKKRVQSNHEHIDTKINNISHMVGENETVLDALGELKNDMLNNKSHVLQRIDMLSGFMSIKYQIFKSDISILCDQVVRLKRQFRNLLEVAINTRRFVGIYRLYIQKTESVVEEHMECIIELNQKLVHATHVDETLSDRPPLPYRHPSDLYVMIEERKNNKMHKENKRLLEENKRLVEENNRLKASMLEDFIMF